jgi:hypothetical protein
MLNNNKLQEIKRNLNRGTSAIFVIGQGAHPKEELFFNNKSVKDLYSGDKEAVSTSWKSLYETNQEPTELPFISGFTKFVQQTAPIKLARFNILNTAISVSADNMASNTNVINLNGSLHKGIDPKSGVLKSVQTLEDIDSLLPIFIPADKNYDSLYDAVCKLEERVSEQDVRSIFFIGTSGNCPIVESLFNRSLLRTLIKDPVYKVVVNPNSTYLDEEADLVIREDAHVFLKWLETAYTEAEGFFE